MGRATNKRKLDKKRRQQARYDQKTPKHKKQRESDYVSG